jgi:uncharacterized membrane protein
MIILKFSYLLFLGLSVAGFAISYKRNSWFGYRTKFSLANDQNWKLANRITSYFLLFFGVILFFVHKTTSSPDTIILAVVLFALLSMVLTEIILYFLKKKRMIK